MQSEIIPVNIEWIKYFKRWWSSSTLDRFAGSVSRTLNLSHGFIELADVVSIALLIFCRQADTVVHPMYFFYVGKRNLVGLEGLV